MTQYNPRYSLYAKQHGKSEEEMISFDKERAPGGCMGPFILWIGERLRELRASSPQSFYNEHLLDHDAFDAYLRDYVEEKTKN